MSSREQTIAKKLELPLVIDTTNTCANNYRNNTVTLNMYKLGKVDSGIIW